MDVTRCEIHIINKNHRLFKYCDDVCFKSKNLYNYANYLIRQKFINESQFITAYELNKRIKNEPVFKELPSKTSQQIIIKLGQNWSSFFKSIKDWKNNNNKYKAKPNIPKYKDRNGRFIVLFDHQQRSIKNGKYIFPKSNMYIETNVNKEQLRQVQIIPYGSC